MTTIDSSPDTATESSAIGRLLAADVDWLTSTDHKKVGRLFLGGGLLGLLATVVVNVLIAVERVSGTSATFAEDTWVQLFSAQRFGLVFGAALPLAVGLAVAVTPLQLGARSIAFPRLAQTGFFMWFGGFVLSIVAVASNGGFGDDADMIDLFLAAHVLMALGLAAGAASIVTSVMTTRAPGMTMRRVPFFAFSTLIFGIGLLIVLPILVGALVYLFVDHRSGAGELFADGVSEYALWAFGQPTTFLFAIPVIGLFAELLPTTFRKRTPLRGVVFAGLSLVGVAALAGSTQQTVFDVPWAGSQLYIGGGDDLRQKVEDVAPWAIFHLLPILGAGLIFLMFLFLAKPEKNSRPHLIGAFPFAVFGFGMVLVGMHGAALLPIVDFGLLGTVFDEASLIYVVYGIALGTMGGIVYWAPKLWGVVLDLAKVGLLALLGVTATVLASFPHYIAGFLNQPAGFRVTDNDLQIWNVIVLVGHSLMAVTVLAFIGLLTQSVLGRGDRSAADDPFDAHTIEWATTSPAPTDNFVDVPMITSAEPLLDRKSANDADGSDS
ncbi:MAG: cbb3-type cytochrome c oxidase subunit I [Actinomycetota bacterium]